MIVWAVIRLGSRISCHRQLCHYKGPEGLGALNEFKEPLGAKSKPAYSRGLYAIMLRIPLPFVCP